MSGSCRRSVVVIFCLVLTLKAQNSSNPPVVPGTVPSPLRSVAGGMAESWDGRLFVLQRMPPPGKPVWDFELLRPEAVTRNPANGLPVLDAGAVSDAIPLDVPPGFNTMALVPTPGFDPNPFRCDSTGTASSNGSFECYKLTIYTHTADDNFQNHLGKLRATVVVADPRTPNATPRSVTQETPFEEIQTVNGNPVLGIEPTLTPDGRLLIFHGNPGDILKYTWNPTPEDPRQWREPRSLTDMYPVDRDQLVAGVPFADRYPIARAALKSADGQPLPAGSAYRGAYPWISQEGAELFHTATQAGLDGRDRGRRGGISVIGRWTSHALRHIDGPINPNRNARTELISTRLFTSSPGADPGNWTPFRDPSGPIPYLKGRPVYPIFSAVGAVENVNVPGAIPEAQSPGFYGEVSLEDTVEGNYVLSLHMNELISSQFEIDPTRTPDTSGRFNTGLLEGAQFPQEFNGTDGNIGVGGQAVIFSHSARVRVPYSPSLDETRQDLTVQLFVNRLMDMNQDAADRPLYLVNKAGSWGLTLEEDGRIEVSVFVNGHEILSGPVGPPLALGQWTHVAFTYAGALGRLKIYVGGSLAETVSTESGQIAASNQDLVIGPGSQTPKPDFLTAGQPVVLIDEVAVSRVERTAAEIARAAYHP